MAVPQQEQADAAAAAEARQQAAFPPPPPYFHVFRSAADAVSRAADGGSLSDAHPLRPPPLPAAPDATFQLFGELHTVGRNCRGSKSWVAMLSGPHACAHWRPAMSITAWLVCCKLEALELFTACVPAGTAGHTAARGATDV